MVPKVGLGMTLLRNLAVATTRRVHSLSKRYAGPMDTPLEKEVSWLGILDIKPLLTFLLSTLYS